MSKSNGTKEYFVGKPSVWDAPYLSDSLNLLLTSGIYSNNGPEVRTLEAVFSMEHNVKYSIAFCNATVALESILECLEIKNKVIEIPSFTFIGVPQAIKRSGNIVKFLDINSNYFMEDSKADFCIPTNLFGYLSKHENNNSIYDSAHCVGMGEGNKGVCEFFSLHATKIIHSMEGGIVTTEDKELSDLLKQYRNFGYDINGPINGEVVSYGTNFKMSEIHAAVGNHNLYHADKILKHYKNNHFYYSKYLPQFVELKKPNHDNSNYSYIVCEVSELIRDKLLDYLHSNNIFARKYFPPLHLSGPFKEPISLPNTERIAKRIFQLPTGLTIKKEDIIQICEVISKFKA